MSYDILKKAIQNHNNIVFLSGIGCTRELGIPHYTDAEQAYEVEKKYRYSPEDIFSSTFYNTRPELFYRYYREHILYLDKQPNEAYYALAHLEQAGKLRAIVTRSIYSIHSLAGSQNVIELYGSIRQNKCIRCGTRHSVEYIKESRGIPRCMKCQGAIRPEVSFYGDLIDNGRVTAAADAISQADMLIVGGTNLDSYLARRFLQYFHGDELALINTEKHFSDQKANIIIYDAVSNVLPQVISQLDW